MNKASASGRDPEGEAPQTCGLFSSRGRPPREVLGTLDEIRLEGEFLTNIGGRLFVERVLRVRDVLGVVVPSVVSDVLRHVSELLERLVKGFSASGETSSLTWTFRTTSIFHTYSYR